MLFRKLVIGSLAVLLSTLQAGAVTIMFGGGPDNLDTLDFEIDGVPFQVTANGQTINQSANGGLGVGGPNAIEGRRIAGADVLILTFASPVFISEITFAEFNGGIDAVGIVANGVEVSDNIPSNNLGVELVAQGDDAFGVNDSRQSFSASVIGILGTEITTLAISRSLGPLAGQAGITLSGFTATAVPLPAPLALMLLSLLSFAAIGRLNRAAQINRPAV